MRLGRQPISSLHPQQAPRSGQLREELGEARQSLTRGHSRPATQVHGGFTHCAGRRRALSPDSAPYRRSGTEVQLSQQQRRHHFRRLCLFFKEGQVSLALTPLAFWKEGLVSLALTPLAFFGRRVWYLLHLVWRRPPPSSCPLPQDGTRRGSGRRWLNSLCVCFSFAAPTRVSGTGQFPRCIRSKLPAPAISVRSRRSEAVTHEGTLSASTQNTLGFLHMAPAVTELSQQQPPAPKG